VDCLKVFAGGEADSMRDCLASARLSSVMAAEAAGAASRAMEAHRTAMKRFNTAEPSIAEPRAAQAVDSAGANWLPSAAVNKG
jgi:serine/threonine-protein kinase RIO1